MYYILKYRKPIHCDDVMKWGKWFERSRRRRVRLTYLDGCRISTAFLGLDHNYSGGRPLLFETMIFGLLEDDEYQTRCTTHRQALQMHKDAVLVATKP